MLVWSGSGMCPVWNSSKPEQSWLQVASTIFQNQANYLSAMSDEMKPCPQCANPYGYSMGEDFYTCPECGHEWSLLYDEKIDLSNHVELDLGSYKGVGVASITLLNGSVTIRKVIL